MIQERYQKLYGYFIHAINVYLKSDFGEEEAKTKGELKRIGVGLDQETLYAYLDYSNDGTPDRYREQVYISEILLECAEKGELDLEEVEDFTSEVAYTHFAGPYLGEKYDDELVFSISGHFSFRYYVPFLMAQLALDLKEKYQIPDSLMLADGFSIYSFTDVQKFYVPSEVRSLKKDIESDGIFQEEDRDTLYDDFAQAFFSYCDGSIGEKFKKALPLIEKSIGKTYDEVFRDL